MPVVCAGKRGKGCVETEKNTTVFSKRLPQEVIDIIVDYLHDDSRALAVAALVCRSWVPARRYHLFEVIETWSPNISTLGQLLASTRCTFASSIREIHIEPLLNECANSIRTTSRCIDPLAGHLSKLESVRKLRVSGVHMPINWQKLLKETGFTSRITHLWLCSLRLDSFRCWMEILKSFPSLVKLRYGASQMVDDTWRETDLPSNIDWTLSQKLRSFEVESYGSCPIQQVWSQNMWAWLLKSQVRLTELELNSLVYIATDANAREALSSFSRYLRFLGPSLRKLQLDFKNKHSIVQFFGCVDMTENTGIREWQLAEYCLYYDGDSKSLDYHFLTLPKFLSLLPTQASLFRISFRLVVTPLDYDSIQFLNCIDQEDGDAAWKSVDALLTGPSFPSLKEIVVDAVMDGDHGFDSLQSLQISEYLNGKLPMFLEKGSKISCNYRLQREIKRNSFEI